MLRQHRRPGDPTALGDEAAGNQDAPRRAAPLTLAAVDSDAALDRGGEHRLTALLPRPALQFRAAVGKDAAVGPFASS